MKSIYLMGVIALLAMVMAVPVMAADPSVVVNVGGSIAEPCIPSLSISTESGGIGGPLALDFGPMEVGENFLENAGNLHVQSQCTAWSVGAPTTSPDVWGYMTDGGNTLSNPLYQKDVNNGGGYAWIKNFPAGTGWLGFNGVYTAQLWDFAYPLSYQQTVDAEDIPGDYSISLTYTVSAV